MFQVLPPPITGCRSLPSLLCSCVTSLNSLPFLCGTLLEKELWTWAPCACVSLSEANLSYFGLQLGSGDYWAVTDVSVRNSRCSGNSHHILLGWWQMEWSNSSAASHIWCGLSDIIIIITFFVNVFRRELLPCGLPAAGCWTRWWGPALSVASRPALGAARAPSDSHQTQTSQPTHLRLRRAPTSFAKPVDFPFRFLGKKWVCFLLHSIFTHANSGRCMCVFL